MRKRKRKMGGAEEMGRKSRTDRKENEEKMGGVGEYMKNYVKINNFINVCIACLILYTSKKNIQVVLLLCNKPHQLIKTYIFTPRHINIYF